MMLPTSARPIHKRLTSRFRLAVVAGFAAVVLLFSIAAVSAGTQRAPIGNTSATGAWQQYREGERAPLAAQVDSNAAFQAWLNYRQGERAPLVTTAP
jgi:hypothetical protein